MKHTALLSMFCVLAGTLMLTPGCGGKGDDHAAPTEQKAEKAQKYHCPMHPTYVSDKPGSCPICGMDLVPIDATEHTGAAGAGTNMEGRTSIMIDGVRRQQIGVTTATVEVRRVTRTIRASATVEYDETRWTKVSPRVGGWVEALYVNYTGQHVEKGQPLFKLYSPEMRVTQQEYRNALATGDERLIAAARHRLMLWNISEDQIAALEKGGEAKDTIDILSPATGDVIRKNIQRGQQFTAGETLYEISDLSHVWVHANVYEYELAHVSTGMPATVYLSYQPDRHYPASVMFVYPTIDEASRTLEIRLEADNPDRQLRPDMWANVELEVDLGEGPTVPASAVIETGHRRVVFVDKGDGEFEPREINVRGQSDDYYLVESGVEPGEQVVTRALFMIDSESQLKAAIAGMSENKN